MRKDFGATREILASVFAKRASQPRGLPPGRSRPWGPLEPTPARTQAVPWSNCTGRPKSTLSKPASSEDGHVSSEVRWPRFALPSPAHRTPPRVPNPRGRQRQHRRRPPWLLRPGRLTWLLRCDFGRDVRRHLRAKGEGTRMGPFPFALLARRPADSHRSKRGGRRIFGAHPLSGGVHRASHGCLRKRRLLRKRILASHGALRQHRASVQYVRVPARIHRGAFRTGHQQLSVVLRRHTLVGLPFSGRRKLRTPQYPARIGAHPREDYNPRLRPWPSAPRHGAPRRRRAASREWPTCCARRREARPWGCLRRPPERAPRGSLARLGAPL